MSKLLDNYTIDARTRYESHRLIYTPENDEPIEFGGFLAAAILAALIVDTDEGDAREISIDTPEQRQAFFLRYEREVRRDNGGLFTTEVQALSEAYMELEGSDEPLALLCRNERLYDLAVGLTVEYMQRLVHELVCDRIFDKEPWTGPFAQWLFNAGFVETRRQHLLSVDWTDPAAVYALSEELIHNESPEPLEPTFIFEDLSAEQVLNGYWEWLWGEAQKEANLFPDAKVQLAQIKQIILKEETDYEFIKPEMKHFTQEQINLFRAWMNQWIDFVKEKIEPPVSTRKKDLRQELFLDNISPIPPEHNYVEVKKYILERCRYDQEFKKYFRAHKMTEMCRQLSFLFGWEVDDNALGKRMRSKAKK
jgi:hypothetical protein